MHNEGKTTSQQIYVKETQYIKHLEPSRHTFHWQLILNLSVVGSNVKEEGRDALVKEETRGVYIKLNHCTVHLKLT